MRKNATKLAAAVLSLAMVMTSVSMPASAAKKKTTKINKSTATLYTNGSKSQKSTTLYVTVGGKKVKATFKSSNTKILTVAKKTGKVTAKKPGKATVTATYKKKNYKCTVTVKAYATSVKVSPTTVSLVKGKTKVVKATVSPSNASNKKVSFKSSNKAVATVSSTGKITAKKAGTAKITVTALGSKNDAKKAYVTVKVTNPAPAATETPVVTETPAATETPVATVTPSAVATEGTITITTNVSGASVKVVSGTAVVAEGTIGADSKFTTTKLENGTYTVKVTKLGYKDFSKEVVVKGDVTETVVLEKEAAPTAATASAIGVKKLQVVLNATVLDTTKAVVTVKKGVVPVSTDKITFADDKKTINIDTTGKLTKGEYTITVAGVADKELTAKVQTADEKVAKIDIKTTTAPVVANGVNAKVNFKVYNQYNEDVTSLFGGQITWTASTSKPVVNTNAAKGEIEVPNAGGQAYAYGSKIYLTGVHSSSGTVVNKELTTGVAVQEDEVTFKGVYNVATKKLENLPANFKAGKYVLLYSVKDQYGNPISYKNVNKNNLVFTTTNPLFIDPTLDTDTNTFDIDNETYLGVKLLPGSQVENGGDATVKVISKNTGKSATYDIKATAASQVKTFALSTPESIVGEGETVEIPFAAVDQYGKSITKYSDLVGKITFNNTNIRFKEKSDGTAKLLYTATLANNHPTDDVDIPVYLTSFVKNGGDFSSLMVYVKAAKRPTRVRGLHKDVFTNIGGVAGNAEEFGADKILIEDQYGRLMSRTEIESWLGASVGNKILIKSEKPTTDKSPFTVGSEETGSGLFTDTSVATVGAIGAKVKVAVIGAGLDQIATTNATEKLEISLYDGTANKDIAASDAEVTFYKVAQSEYADYCVDDLGTMYNETDATDKAKTNSAYDKTVNAYGLKQDGTKVKLLASQFEVRALNDAKVDVTNNVISDKTVGDGYLEKDFLDSLGKKITKTVKIEVGIKDGKSGAIVKTITKDLILSTEAPKVASIGLSGVTDGEANINNSSTGALASGDLLNFINMNEVKDQYGVSVKNSGSYLNNSGNPAGPVMTITDISDKSFEQSADEADKDFIVDSNKSGSANIAGAHDGDMFTVTYSYDGVSQKVVFTVVGNPTA